MKSSLSKSAVVAVLGLTFLALQGCGMKWLQSDGDQAAGTGKTGAGEIAGQSDRMGDGKLGNNSGGSGSEWNGQGVNPNFPGIAQDGQQGGGLSGFSQSPSEEYLTQGSGIASVSSDNARDRHLGELSREEKAAMEAGLKDVFFAYDQWTIPDEGMEVLNRNAAWLKEHPGAVLKVEGHCDERGTTDYNIVLGEKRSKSARSYMVELGISPKQVAVVSYGKERPFCMEHDESCYQQNRRGHVLLRVKSK